MGETIDCQEFILTGRFGPIQPGDVASAVLREFGEPSWYRPPDCWSGLIGYGHPEFYVDDDHVTGITFLLREPHEDDVQLPVINIPRGDDASSESIQALLALHQIGHRVDRQATDDYQTVWITSKNITLIFDDEDQWAKIGAYAIL